MCGIFSVAPAYKFIDGPKLKENRINVAIY
jgi:hypothetical protein